MFKLPIYFNKLFFLCLQSFLLTLFYYHRNGIMYNFKEENKFFADQICRRILLLYNGRKKKKTFNNKT